jgi:hypothetical protein
VSAAACDYSPIWRVNDIDGRSGVDLDIEQKGNIVPLLFAEEDVMVRAALEEAATLASITLFLGMISVWAHIIPRL